ncbi:MAG: hypothetical protein KIS85_07405 [Anaerolineales bacterium]|nr:hypothetical protein [Anaerolineales bacterium]
MGKQPRSRKGIRLPEYDYAQPGAYFVTISSYKKVNIFGTVVHEEVQLNDFGEIAQRGWQAIPKHFASVSVDAFIVMPNHIHGILFINEDEASVQRKNYKQGQTSQIRVGAQHAAPIDAALDQISVGARHASPLHKSRGASSGSLGAIIGSYKSSVSREVNKLRRATSPPIWQRNYYERVVRNQEELDALRHYVTYNFLKPLTYRNG